MDFCFFPSYNTIDAIQRQRPTQFQLTQTSNSAHAAAMANLSTRLSHSNLSHDIILRGSINASADLAVVVRDPSRYLARLFSNFLFAATRNYC